MNTKHTPGPWYVDVNDHQGFIRGAEATVRNIEEGDNGMTVSGLMVTGCGSYVDGFPQLSFPDAHLIAAAPELLEALQALTKWANVTAGDREPGSILDKDIDSARAAIAKATRG